MQEATTRDSWLDRPVLSFDSGPGLRLNLETLLYGLILVAAVLTRFWDLGARTMSHDESLHTVYSWNLYVGKGYQHNPMMHGPFLFHATALSYFLFGDNDFTARIPAALLGVVLVMTPLLFRRWLGRKGALITSVLLLISPSIMYYSRYIRNDVFSALWFVLLLWAFFRYLETRTEHWLYLGAAFAALNFASKETAFIYHAILGFYLVFLLFWQWLQDPHRSLREYPAFDLVIVLGTLCAPFLAPLPIKMLGFDPIDYSSYGIVRSGIIFFVVVLATIGVGMWWDWRRWSIAAATFTVITVLLFTTFFTNGQGLATGFIGSMGYWLAQQGVKRGGQPWFYYILLIPMYEFTPLLFSFLGTIYYLARGGDGTTKRRATDSAWLGSIWRIFLVYWLVMTWLAYTIAGEKMPWLAVHFAVPLAFLAGCFVGDVLERLDWAEARRRGAGWLAVVLPVLLVSLAALLWTHPFRGMSIPELSDTTQWLAALAMALGMLAWLARLVRNLGWDTTLRTGLAVFLVLLSLLTVRYAWLACFINYDTAKELLVYAHGTPDVKLVMREIEALSRRTVGDKGIKVAYDDDSTWPFEWYLRDYYNRAYFGAQPTREVLQDAPVVIVGPKNWDKVKPFLGNRYYRFDYRLIWWPKQDYMNFKWESIRPTLPDPDKHYNVFEQATITFQRVWEYLSKPENRRKLWNIYAFRKYDVTLDKWSPDDKFALFVRKDVANKLWDFRVGPVPEEEIKEPYSDVKKPLTSLKVWGSQGTGEGQFQDPRGIAVDAERGYVYVVDSGNHRIQKFDLEGNFITAWGSNGNGTGQFQEPWGIAVDAEGNVYVADTWNHRIQKFTADGGFINMWGTHGMTEGQAEGQPFRYWGPRDVAIGPDGNVYITDTGNKRVLKYTPNGKFLGQFGGKGSDKGQLDEPVGIALDAEGFIYVADTWNQRVQVFNPDFEYVLQWPIEGWYGQSLANKPYIAVDARRRVYVTDPEGFRVLVFDNQGKPLAWLGDYGFDATSFSLPTGIALDGEGNIYVTDTVAHRVMKFAPLP